MPTPKRAGRRTSTYSDHGSGCVAVDFISDASGTATELVEVTHSKIANSPAILFTPTEWNAWQDEVAADKLANSNGRVSVVVREEHWHVSDNDSNVSLTFNETEWTAFRKGVLDLEFAPDNVFRR
ncbi:DUF397 domain-containing protein [Nocardia arthritidis]|uniref:DUF397 domain-containing protein n=1 Tax=Nocardia arthritidis TaxID=228602 RepID=A0A6G9YL81_9NOCA|nr:DUF397 domain-containing protein [Nocardia arthritidis]QIS13958.1 DUF397 domain-containing protein [Nocardia arthritidis]